MLVSGVFWNWCGRCCKKIAVGCLCGLPLCEACEMRERAAPSPPPPAVSVGWPEQLHFEAEMDVNTAVLQRTTIAGSGAIGNPYTGSGTTINAPTPPDRILVYSGRGMCWFDQSQPVVSGDQTALTPFWPVFGSSRSRG